MSNGNTAVATAPAANKGQLLKLLQDNKQQIAMALPKHLTPERMIRMAITAARTPALAECTPLSILGCTIQAAELGLELTGPLGQAYMVPYYDKNTRSKQAQFQIGYRGLMDLAYRSGRVETFAAHCVYKNDVFSYAYGTKPFLKHVPTMSDPGEVVAVYAVITMKGGGSDFEVMSKVQIDAHRAKYSKQKSEYSPWETAWNEMACKTVIRKLAKRAPVSIELQRAASVDEYGEAGLPTNIAFDLQATTVETNGHGNGQSRTDALSERLLAGQRQGNGEDVPNEGGVADREPGVEAE